MHQLILNLKQKFPDCLGEVLKDEETGKLKAIIYATPTMKSLTRKYMDLLVIDTTFGTNHFRMKHWTMCGKNNENKTIIFAEGLATHENIEQFSWFLLKVKDYIQRDPEFILTDADPALISSVEIVYPNSNLKLCG